METVEQHAEHRLRVALRIVGSDVRGDDVGDRRERGADLVGLVLDEAAVLAHEHARVAGATGSVAQREQFVDERAQRVGAARRSSCVEQRRTDRALLGEQRDEEVVLAAEAPVERLQREARPAPRPGPP